MAATDNDWTSLPQEHKLSQFAAALPGILEITGYGEMYGVELQAPTDDKPAPHATLLVLQKFLRANVDDLLKAKEQLTGALNWRKDYQPLKAKDEVFSADKFGGLGYVTKVKGATETGNEEDVVTFNIYGAAAKDPSKTFGDTEAFVRWRVALAELSIEQLKLSEATKAIPDYGKGRDPYKAVNVHDYLSVSFFRQPAEIKASSSKIIDMFQKYYPETVSYKYFINVPIIMQWMMGAMKAFLSKDSIQTMTWMTYGSELHRYLGTNLPREYGGDGASLAGVSLTPKYDNAEAAEAKTEEATAAAANASGTSTAEPTVAPVGDIKVSNAEANAADDA